MQTRVKDATASLLLPADRSPKCEPLQQTTFSSLPHLTLHRPPSDVHLKRCCRWPEVRHGTSLNRLPYHQLDGLLHERKVSLASRPRFPRIETSACCATTSPEQVRPSISSSTCRLTAAYAIATGSRSREEPTASSARRLMPPVRAETPKSISHARRQKDGTTAR